MTKIQSLVRKMQLIVIYGNIVSLVMYIGSIWSHTRIESLIS